MKSTHILFLTTQLPYPPKSGGTVKSWNYVKFLSQNYTLSVASLLKDDDKKHAESFKRAINLDQFVCEELSIERTPINLLKSYFSAPCLNAFRNYSPIFGHKVAELLKSADAVIVDHYEVFQYVTKDFRGKVIMHTHNAEFMLWQRMSELTNNPIKKLILKIEANRVKKYEALIFEQSDLIYSTPADIELYKKYHFDTQKHHLTYHLGNDNLLELPDLQFKSTEKAFTFIGTLSWEPNIDGICWFIDNCWTKIQQTHPEVKLYILGSNPNERILKSAKSDPNIVFTGFVQDLDTYLQKTRVSIAPLRFGSGMKVKVLEGLYRGTPTVTTSVGAEGLELINGENSIIADNPKNFIDGCLTLLENEKLWNSFRDKTRKLAAEEYTWKALFAKMEKSIQEIIYK
ncbi:MAG: glycosyltransferase involved in cell wall biosynthesis [Vicingaceae bacterium]